MAKKTVAQTLQIPPAVEYTGVVEALLLSVDKPLSTVRVIEGLGLVAMPTAQEGELLPQEETVVPPGMDDFVRDVVKLLNESYEATGRSFRIELVSGGWRVMTLPKYAEHIARLQRRVTTGKLSRPAIETLAIIAYKQPMTRAELEAIRGVACGEVLKSLMERRLVTIKGRAEELGRPILYGTTKSFLDQFGLASIRDLPTLSELKPGVPAERTA